MAGWVAGWAAGALQAPSSTLQVAGCAQIQSIRSISLACKHDQRPDNNNNTTDLTWRQSAFNLQFRPDVSIATGLSGPFQYIIFIQIESLCLPSLGVRFKLNFAFVVSWWLLEEQQQQQRKPSGGEKVAPGQR